MNISKYIFSSTAFIFSVMALMPAHAQMLQQKSYGGMHHLQMNPKPAPQPQTPSIEDELSSSQQDKEPATPTYKALSPSEALVKPDDLETWNHLDEAALATSDLELQKLIHIIESDRGAVPPQGLFLAAKSLADRGMMEQAAVYLFVAQLRLEFDMARWPATPNKDDVKRRDQDKKKTADQALPNQNKTVRMDNPHAGVKNLGDQIGAPIIAWALKGQGRLDKVIQLTRTWDVSSPYAYLPNYDLTAPVPFEKWERLLTNTREGYFTRLINWSKMMKKAHG